MSRSKQVIGATGADRRVRMHPSHLRRWKKWRSATRSLRVSPSRLCHGSDQCARCPWIFTFSPCALGVRADGIRTLRHRSGVLRGRPDSSWMEPARIRVPCASRLKRPEQLQVPFHWSREVRKDEAVVVFDHTRHSAIPAAPRTRGPPKHRCETRHSPRRDRYPAAVLQERMHRAHDRRRTPATSRDRHT